MLHEIGNLVKALHQAADVMAQTQVDFAEAGRNLNALTGTYADRLTRLSSDIEEIKSLLRDGFRLSSH
jgi:ABC-type transporter Mla subunit MlaD